MRGFGLAAALFTLVGAQARADDVIKLTPIDLSVQTHKWEGKTIETTAQCFYADTNEYRCLSPGGPRMDFETLEPEAAKKSIESNCDTMAKFVTPACKVRIQFVYDRFDSMKNDNGTTFPLILVKDGRGAIVGK